jgi:hypothetical protein
MQKPTGKVNTSNMEFNAETGSYQRAEPNAWKTASQILTTNKKTDDFSSNPDTKRTMTSSVKPVMSETFGVRSNSNKNEGKMVGTISGNLDPMSGSSYTPISHPPISTVMTNQRNCPMCGSIALEICQCARQDSRCANGHMWHLDVVGLLKIGSSHNQQPSGCNVM